MHTHICVLAIVFLSVCVCVYVCVCVCVCVFCVRFKIERKPIKGKEYRAFEAIKPLSLKTT